MIPVIPRGFRDVLPTEARWRETIIRRVQACLSLWGYAPIETPTLEVMEVLEAGGAFAKTPFRLFDLDGKLLALRPDGTLPVARLTASRLSLAEGPFRFRYVQSVFREEESLRGQAREFTQIGVESIGLDGPVSDAEVVALLVDALRACGLKRFTVAICTVGVLRELLDACTVEGAADEVWRDGVLAACHSSNLVELDRLAADVRIDPRFGIALRELVNIRGGRDAIAACRALVKPLDCLDGLDDLERTWELLEAIDATDSVVIDFSVMSSFNYYTGLVIEAYAPGLGVMLGSGGRYDHMLEAYGCSAPAAGFAFGLERVMHALGEQDVYPDEVAAQAVVVKEDNPASAFVEAARLRAEDICTVMVTPAAASSESMPRTDLSEVSTSRTGGECA